MSTIVRPISQRIGEIIPVESIRASFRTNWAIWLVIVSSIIQSLSLWRILSPLTENTYPPLKDSIIFEYIGWYLSHGGRLYIDIWEIKPPLAFETTAALAVLTDGNILLYHGLVLLVTNAVAVGSALVVGELTHELTDDPAASFTSGLALFALPVFHWRSAIGFKPKYFVVLFGLLGVYLVLRNRPFLAGGASALSVGYWQLAIVFPVLVLGLAYQRRGHQNVLRVVAGGSFITMVILAPIVWWGAIDEMVVETVLTPLLISNESRSVVARLRFAVYLFGRHLPLALLGVIGLIVGVRKAPRSRWWLLAGASWFAVQMTVLDLDAYPDLIPGFAFVALGIGLMLGDLIDRQRAVHGFIIAMVMISVITLGSLHVPAPTHPPELGQVEPPYWRNEQAALLWRTIPTKTCHPFPGVTETKLIRRYGGSIVERTCGSVDRVWPPFRNRYIEPIVESIDLRIASQQRTAHVPVRMASNRDALYK